MLLNGVYLKIMKPIFLCGFMGCGKSTVGKRLACALKCSFIDMDDYIEKQEGRSISEIFEAEGEEYFRNLETETIKKLGNEKGVIATGGGALLREENGRAAKKFGIPVFIDTKFSVCYNRIKGDKNRPLAYNSKREDLKRLFDKRKRLYIRNSVITVSGGVPVYTVVKNIIKEINKFNDKEKKKYDKQQHKRRSK